MFTIVFIMVLLPYKLPYISLDINCCSHGEGNPLFINNGIFERFYFDRTKSFDLVQLEFHINCFNWTMIQIRHNENFFKS